jgi:hypothetical protein
VRISHAAARVRASFDDPGLVSCAGLEPVLALARRCGLHGIVGSRLDVPSDKGSNASGKVAAIVAGMLTGADSIDDLDVLRHGGMPVLFDGVYAPSTLGSFLRAFTHGHVRQLQAASRQFLVRLAGRVPLLPGAGAVTFVDVDSLLRRVYGKQKQGAAFGHAKVGGYQVLLRGLNPLVATISTPDAAPVIAATQLRAGNAGSARGAASLVAEASPPPKPSSPPRPPRPPSPARRAGHLPARPRRRRRRPRSSFARTRRSTPGRSSPPAAGPGCGSP